MLEEKIEQATKTLKLASQMSQQYYHKPLVLAYSGGKDSEVLLDLAIRSGIEFEVINNHTTVDAPPTVYHIQDVFEGLKNKGIKATILYPMYKGKRTSMWELIPQKSMPPTRIVRYCCTVLKEASTPNSFVALGVRSSESRQRADRESFEVLEPKKKNKKMFSLEHAEEVYQEAQYMDEVWDCSLIQSAKKNKNLVCNPIISWTDADIWDYIRANKIRVNPLYECGYTRVGCVGCPMAGKHRYKEFSDFPKYELNYKLAFGRMLDEIRATKPTTWKNADDVFRWWMEDENIEGQTSLEDMIDADGNVLYLGG